MRNDRPAAITVAKARAPRRPFFLLKPGLESLVSARCPRFFLSLQTGTGHGLCSANQRRTESIEIAQSRQRLTLEFEPQQSHRTKSSAMPGAPQVPTIPTAVTERARLHHILTRARRPGMSEAGLAAWPTPCLEDHANGLVSRDLRIDMTRHAPRKGPALRDRPSGRSQQPHAARRRG